jgi:CubicO group peptidase (beta-lactamase class C family)
VGAVAIAILSLLAVTAATNSQLPASNSLDPIFAQFTRETPGCAVGVFKDGAMLYARGYGMASLEHGVPITPDSVFYAGSLSKQFTAFAAALAMKQGRLAYEDSIRKYLPELPAYADAIRVRHLIHHTSGLRDYNTLLSIAGRRDEDAWDNRAVLRITARQKALNFEPGAESLYSNTGYTLLATIVERASGIPFARYAEQQIFTPLGMTHTHFHTDARRLVPHRAFGYGGRAGAWTLDTPVNERAGAGGLYTTIPDLLKWDENFYTGKVGGADLITQVQTPGRLDTTAPLVYAWGLQIREFRDVRVIEHSGALGGYRAHLFRAPSLHASVALLCNTATASTATLARQVASAAFKEGFGAEVCCGALAGTVASERGTLPGIGAELWYREFAGTYYSEELDATFSITSDGSTVFLQRDVDAAPVPLEGSGPVSEFRVRGTTLRFVAIPGQPVTRFTVDAGRVRGIVFDRKTGNP